MGMNKKFRVSFDLTVTMSDAQEQAFSEALLEGIKDQERQPYWNEIIIQSLTKGPEGAVEQMIKQGVRELIKDTLRSELGRSKDDFGSRVSPARVEVLK